MESSQDITTSAGVGEVSGKQLSKRNTSNHSLTRILLVIFQILQTLQGTATRPMRTDSLGVRKEII